jgi:hypothetical protein
VFTLNTQRGVVDENTACASTPSTITAPRTCVAQGAARQPLHSAVHAKVDERVSAIHLHSMQTEEERVKTA